MISHPIAVCDFSASFTRVAHVKRSRKPPFVEVLGLGECSTEGLKEGCYEHLADAAESLWIAAKTAQRQSGWTGERLIVSLDDPFLDSVQVRGSSHLDGNAEEFQLKHAQEARKQALQKLDPQDKHLVYEKEAGYLIDGRDYIQDPIGICGKELTVVLQILFSASAQAQNLRRIAERAGLTVRALFPSGLAALHGILPRDEMQSRGWLLLAGEKVCHALIFEHGAIQEYQSFVVSDGSPESGWSRITDLIQKADVHDEARFFITGEASEDETWRERLLQSVGRRFQFLSPRLEHPQLASPAYAVLAGLYLLAPTRKKKTPEIKTLTLLWHGARARAQSFVQEYF